MSENKKLIDLDNKKSVMNFLQQPTVKIAEVLTGILASDMKDYKLSAGQIVQASIRGRCLTQLGKELEEYRDKGKIKEDYFESDKNRMSLCELLKFIDGDAPDEERFRAMKSIFLASISKSSTKKDEEIAYEIMQICKKLSSGEILILKAAFAITNGNFKQIYSKLDLQTKEADKWFEIISQQIGHGIPELIQRHEINLINLQLIAPRNQPHNFNIPQSSFSNNEHFRLTKAGYKLCKFITKYK